jgi:hypothetical protein
MRWWWARQDSNLQPIRYERIALTIELQAPIDLFIVLIGGEAQLELFGKVLKKPNKPVIPGKNWSLPFQNNPCFQKTSFILGFYSLFQDYSASV